MNDKKPYPQEMFETLQTDLTEEMEKAKTRRIASEKSLVTMLVDSAVLCLRANKKMASRPCDRICEILKDNPDFIKEVMRHKPLSGYKKDMYDFSNLTEDGREPKTLEDMIFYKKEFYNTPEYQKIVSVFKYIP